MSKEYFRIHDQLTIRAVDDISFGIQKRRKVFGLVGGGGCGKSTVARLISGITSRQEGRFCSMEIGKKMQMIFQDSAASLNPRMTVEQIILEPLWIQGESAGGQLPAASGSPAGRGGAVGGFSRQISGALSGGQRQRVAIARSLLLQPGLIVADEPIASLDISIHGPDRDAAAAAAEENRFLYCLSPMICRWSV